MLLCDYITRKKVLNDKVLVERCCFVLQQVLYMNTEMSGSTESEMPKKMPVAEIQMSTVLLHIYHFDI